MGRVWVLLVSIAACSPNVATTGDARGSPMDGSATDPADGARSGSRLKLTWYAFTDGTKQWSGMYDAQTKELCSPYYSAWTDGRVYCVPPIGGTLVYANPSCTTRALLYYTSTTCPQDPANYYLEYGTSTCRSAPAHLYRRGAQIAPATYYTKLSNGACVTDGAPTSAIAIYALGTEVTTDQLVQLSLSAPEGNGRLGTRYYESIDGMRFPWILHDTALGADCFATSADDGSNTAPAAARCVPSDASYAYLAHDPACAVPELAVESACATPSYAYTFPQTSCPDDHESYFTIGAPAAAPPLYYPSGASCLATPPTSGSSYYTLGPKVDVAPLVRTVDDGTAHRVQLAHYTSPEASDGLRFRDPYSLYDAQLGTRCSPAKLPDGSIRCIASGGFISTYYTSSACTTPVELVEVYRGPASCSAPHPPGYGRRTIAPEPGTCTFSTEVHALTTVHAGVVYAGSPGSCGVYTPYEGTLYDIGPVVPLTDFVGAAIAIDS